MIVGSYAVVALIALLVMGAGLLAAATVRIAPEWRPGEPAWAQYRFGFVVFGLVFLAFDMEMIFMYPWAVVFAKLGLEAFADMLVFIALLGAGIAYAWRMGGLRWE